MKTEIKKLEESQVEIKVSIPSEKLMAAWPKALQTIQKVAEVDGFRKGHVPENLLISKFGDMAILEEAAQITIQDAYPTIVTENKLEVLGYPEIMITKLAKDNDLEFTAKVAVMPELELPNYKKIAAKLMKETVEVTVTDEEVTAVIDEVRKSKATKEKVGEEEKETLPEVTDEFVKALGDFTDVSDFKSKVRANILKDKENKEKDKKRVAIVEEIEKETKTSLPHVLIDAEVDRMVAQLRSDVASFGGSFEGYLTHMKKTEADIRKEWHGEAERRAKIQLILNKVAAEEKIVPDQAEIDKEVGHLMEHYKDLEKSRAEGYVFQMMQNEKVMQFFESQK